MTTLFCLGAETIAIANMMSLDCILQEERERERLAVTQLLNPKGSLIEMVGTNYLNWTLALKVEAGESGARPVHDPFSGNLVLPERQTFLLPGNHDMRVGDFAIGQSIVAGQIVQREALQAVYVPSANRYKLKIDIELFDAHGRKLKDNEKIKEEKKRCFGCHGINENTGQLLALDPATGKIDKELPIVVVYQKSLLAKPIPVGERVAPRSH